MLEKARELVAIMGQNEYLTAREAMLLIALREYLQPEDDEADDEGEEDLDYGVFIAEGG